MTRARLDSRRWNRYARLVSIVLTCGLLTPGHVAHAQVLPAQPVNQTDIQRFIPEHATITQQMVLSFGNGTEPGAMAVVYMLPPVYAISYNVGLRILRRKRALGWVVAYEEKDEIDPGGDEWRLQKVKSASGQEGLVVVYYHSGAGTTTDWKLIAAAHGKFVSFDPKPMRDKVLRERHSVFEGYNGVKTDGDIVTETIAGYSEHQARCCPDKPSIAMHVRFTGTAIKLDSVDEVTDQVAK